MKLVGDFDIVIKDMSENAPEFVNRSSVKKDADQEKTHILPAYEPELFREKIAVLNVDDSVKDKINIWWRTIDRTASWMDRANNALGLKDLPKQEKEDVNFGLDSVNAYFEEINASLKDLLAFKPSTIRKWGGELLDFFSDSKVSEDAENLYSKIDHFNQRAKSPSTNQIIAFCEAFKETHIINDTKAMRMKIAQWSFEEMVALFPKIKMWRQFEGISEPEMIDIVDIEKSELVDALKSDLWTAEEISKWQKIYETNRKSMGKFRFEEPVKKSFEFLFRSALGAVSPKYSAVHILKEAENVFQGIKDDDTLREAWDNEAKQDGEIDK